MAASNPGGHLRYWQNGLPVGGVRYSSNDPGSHLYWIDGLPVRLLYGAATDVVPPVPSWPFRPDGSFSWVEGRPLGVLPLAANLLSGEQLYWRSGITTLDLYPLTTRPLSIDSLSPILGPVAGGTAVSIVGADFAVDATVDFDGVPATSVVVVDDEHITCVTPAHALGVVDVVVTNPSVPESVTASGAFSYAAVTSDFPALFIAP